MYEESRKETFSLKDIFLQLLFIVLLVFILIWLFPTKGYLEKRLDGIQSGVNDQLKPLYTRLFTDNILTMKEAAKAYYTTPRLPQNVGDKVSMTLGEMYQKGLLLELVDSNNKACDASKSNVELTKMEDEYQLKTTLSCSDKEAFVIEYLGCYDYCNGKLCSKEENQVKKQVATGVPTPSNPSTPEVAKKYRYEYVKQTGGTCSNYGNWSDWTTNKIEENSTTKVDTKTEKVLAYYKQIYGVVDTKTVNEDYYEDVKFGYSTKTIKKTTTYNYSTETTTKVVEYSTKTNTTSTTVPYAVRTIKKTATYGYSYRQVQSGSQWVNAGIIETTRVMVNTDTVHYELIGSRVEVDCNNVCLDVTYHTYKVTKLQATYSSQKYCAQGTDNGSGCVVVTYVKENYCTQGTDNGSGCTISANQTIYYCPQGENNGKGCVITTTRKYCAKGTDTGSNCQVVTYTTQKYCTSGTDTGSGCVKKIKKTRQVVQLIYGYKNGEAVYKYITYYRSKTKTCVNGTIDYKWSESNNDQTLKSQGYTLTGKTEEIK